MNIITHHKGLSKLKIWLNVSSASDLYNSLKDNRGILEDDLDIYQITSGHSGLLQKENFEFSDASTLCIKHKVPSFIEESMDVDWWVVSDYTQEASYSAEDLAIIASNKLESDKSLWVEVPRITVVSQLPSSIDEVCDTITVSKLNPFS